jgi:hypothetical protein
MPRSDSPCSSSLPPNGIEQKAQWKGKELSQDDL